MFCFKIILRVGDLKFTFGGVKTLISFFQRQIKGRNNVDRNDSSDQDEELVTNGHLNNVKLFI